MDPNKGLIGLSLSAAAMAAVLSGCGRAQAQGPKAQPADRKVELTVYRDDFAMVSEKRPVTLQAGHSKVVVDAISKQLDPNSVLFDWPKGDTSDQVVASTYEMGVGSGGGLLERLNGRQVDMMWPSDNGKPGEVVSGRLEAASQGGGFALRTADKLYVNPPGTIVAPANSAASLLPQLSVETDGSAGGDRQLGISYLTRGMSWSADYVAKLEPNKDVVDLECWATVTNQTGISYPDSKITLITGAPNRAARSATLGVTQGFTSGSDMSGYSNGAVMNYSDSGRPYMRLAPVGELYAYKVPSSASIGQDEMNRVSVFGQREVPIKRDYAIRLPGLSGIGFGDANQTQTHIQATLSISFDDDKSCNLDMPLPGGAVRVYDQNIDGADNYVGAATLGDTTKKEHINLTLSNVFDVYGSCRVVKSEKLNKHTMRKTVEATLWNEKAGPVTLRVVQSYDDTWKPVAESIPSKKLNASNVQWLIPMKAGGTQKLTYTVDIHV